MHLRYSNAHLHFTSKFLSFSGTTARTVHNAVWSLSAPDPSLAELRTTATPTEEHRYQGHEGVMKTV